MASLPNREDRWWAMRAIAKHDLYFMAKIILGYHWITSPVHSDFCREIQRGRNLSLYLLPRGHCKTQVFTIADGIRQYLLHPAEPIAIVCDALKRSVKKTRAIKWHFEKNLLFRDLFPDLTWKNPFKQSPKWTDEEFILPHHTGRQEPSFQATSLENQPTGLHFPIIKCDDIVTPETCTTRDQMDKCRDGYGLMRSSILQTGGNIQIAGTIYNDGDLHCDMAREGTGYTVYRKPAIDPDTGQALWPEQFDLSVLTAIRKDPTVGEYIFSCQYLLDPSPEDENAYFKLTDFGRYRERPKYLNIYAVIDTALSEKTTADYTSIMVVGVSSDNRIQILDVIRGRWDALGVATQMIETQKTHKPLIWGCQGDNIIKAIGPFLRKMMGEQNTYINLQTVTKQNQDKIANGRSIQGRVRQGYVLLPERSLTQPDWLQPLEHEIRRFPRGEHDDQVDNLATVGHLMDSMAAANDKEKRLKDFANTHIDHVEGKKKPSLEEAAHIEAQRFIRNTRNQHRDRRIFHDLD